MAIYILQSIVVEKCISKVMKLAVNHFDISYNNSIVNIIGYVAAPVISFYVLLALSRLIDKLDNYKYTKHLFGFKLTI